MMQGKNGMRTTGAFVLEAEMIPVGSAHVLKVPHGTMIWKAVELLMMVLVVMTNALLKIENGMIEGENACVPEVDKILEVIANVLEKIKLIVDVDVNVQQATNGKMVYL